VSEKVVSINLQPDCRVLPSGEHNGFNTAAAPDPDLGIPDPDPEKKIGIDIRVIGSRGQFRSIYELQL